MRVSLGLIFLLVVCPAGTALDVPDETAMMQVQLKSAQGRSRATTIEDEEMVEFSYYDAGRNASNASYTGPQCNVILTTSDGKVLPTGTLFELAKNVTGTPDAIFVSLIRTSADIVSLGGTTCNCSAYLGSVDLKPWPEGWTCELDSKAMSDQNMTHVDPPTDFVPWNLDRIDARRGFDNSYNVNEGLSTSIYVVDSGILLTHVDASGRAIPGIETEAGNLVLCRPTNKTCSKDTWGHGSHIGGICVGNSAGVLKLGRTVSVRISGADKSTSMSGWMRGFSWIAKYASKPATIASVWSFFGRSTALIRVANTVINSGIVTSTAAGNKLASACQTEPGNYGNWMTVAGTDRWDRRAWWSAFGMCISIFTPGESISAWGYLSNDEFVEMSGTSMATPHGASSAGLILSRAPTLTPADVQMILVGDATKGLLTNIGAGSPNILLYLSTDTGKCFPGEATVDVQDVGHMSMMNLHLGDKVRVKNAAGEQSYEPILGFLHLVHGGVDRPSEFLNVIHSHGQLRATAGHLVFTSAGDMPMSQLQVGDQIVVEGVVGLSKVIAIHQSDSVSGMYAPLTASGTIVVDDVVVSNYAAPSKELRLPHTSAHAFFYPLRFFYQLGLASAPEEKDDALQPFLTISHQWLRLDKAFVRWASY